MQLCGFNVGLDQRFFLIAGTCSIEGLQMSLDVAGQLKEICSALGIPLIYKGSFDKANRSSGSSQRGVGLDAGLKILDEVRRQLSSLSAAMERLEPSHEIIVIDDCSASANLRLLEKLRGECSALRVLRLDSPCGASVALSAGIAAARGETVIAIEPGDAYSTEQIPWLVSWLSRADFVAGRRRRLAGLQIAEVVADGDHVTPLGNSAQRVGDVQARRAQGRKERGHDAEPDR